MLPLLREALASLFKKPFTIRYPYVKVSPPPDYRGKHSFDKKTCIKCRMCQMVCPADALVFDMKKKKPIINLKKCIFCGECAEHCPPKCLIMTKEFSLSGQPLTLKKYSRSEL